MSLFGSALILAGGASRRMGFDKQDISIKGKLLREKTISTLSDIFDDVIISTRKPEIYTGLDVRTVSDILDIKGPMAGIHAALKKCSSDYLFVIACDMPVISPEYINYMKNCLVERQNISPKGIITSIGNDMVEPFHGFYHKSLVETIEAYSLDKFPKFKWLAEKENFILVPKETSDFFNKADNLFLNLNTKEELLSYEGFEEA